jgi:hypothetical protein
MITQKRNVASVAVSSAGRRIISREPSGRSSSSRQSERAAAREEKRSVWGGAHRQWKEVQRGFDRGWVWSLGDNRRLERARVKPQDAANHRSRTALEQSDGRLAQVLGNGALLGAVFSPSLELSLEFE